MSALDAKFKPSKKPPANGSQFQLTKGWADTEEVLDCLQFLLIAITPEIVRSPSKPITKLKQVLSKSSSQPNPKFL